MCRNHQDHDAAMSIYRICVIGFIVCIAILLAGRVWLRVKQIHCAQDCAAMAVQRGWIPDNTRRQITVGTETTWVSGVRGELVYRPRMNVTSTSTGEK